ncbi:site-specific integrase [Dyadobacter psychrotolerans]|uniref:Site-specific integrase n=1 Tax=Dyadobacter psychrotolerans TaxID=2541721 RepID=A0A4R5DNN2_9BACT|nr:site-specific integrase [Dyadobacter psychrotolerans]TDE12323.1 site-specific integrase [Dyadobacter psychrotolerans]
MLEKSFGLLFYLKPAKNQKGNIRYVYLRITVQGKVAELSTKKLWNTKHWNSIAGRATGNKEDTRTLNAYLDMLAAKVHQAKKMLIEDDIKVTAEALKNVLLGKSTETRTILEVFQYHNEQMAALVGKEFAPLTLSRYKTALEHTRSFIQWKYKMDDRRISDLDFEFISEFSFWLRSARGCNHNSAIKYMSNLKKIVLICVNNKWLKKDPFQGFKLTKKEVVKNPLSRAELQRLTEKEFEMDRLNNVRDIFLFCCYTGLAYVDVKQLKRSDIVTGMDGDLWIDTTRQKTDSATRIPLLPTALEIMKKYEDDPLCSNRGVVLPVLSNQKMNAYLKEIATLCGISKTLTFHIARHTFATTVTLSNKVPIETVSKMLGHRSLKQTMVYAKILDVKISEDMKALKERLRNT